LDESGAQLLLTTDVGIRVASRSWRCGAVLLELLELSPESIDGKFLFMLHCLLELDLFLPKLLGTFV